MATPTNLPASFTSSTLASATMNNLRGAFRILQVVSTSTTTTGSSSSGTYADAGLSLSITPQATTSKILVLVAQSAYNGYSGQGIGIRLVRDSTVLQTHTDGVYGGNSTVLAMVTMLSLDSPSTLSAVTYKTQFARTAGSSGVVFVQANTNPSTIVLCEVSA